jgi:ATP-binding cassette subfamily B protein
MIFILTARAEASAKRIVEVLNTSVDIIDSPEILAKKLSPTIQQGKIEFKNVDFKYSHKNHSKKILSNIDFTINPGEFIAIVGSTGSGKTTLVSLIPRLFEATNGSILIDNIDVRDYKLENLRQGIGMVLQQNVLFSGTIKENLLWGNENATQKEIEKACKSAQAHNFIMSFPDGYDNKIEQGGVNVSGGQKQRLCIARALIKKPKILILDDSTSALDTATEAEIRKTFNTDLKDMTVIIIAQRISSVKEANKIIVLNDGKILDIGTHDSLLKTNEIYQEIYNSQQGGLVE